MITPTQIALLALAGLFFAGGWIAALSRLRGESKTAIGLTRGLVSAGCLLSLLLMAHHAFLRGSWLPLGDNFDTLLALAVLLSGLLIYFQLTRPLVGLDWFILPVVILLVIAAGVFGAARPHEYVASAWAWVHHVSSYTSAVAFAVAFAVGAIYLIAHRRLRSKSAPVGPMLGSLERLERITLTSVTLGFGLLSVGVITGIAILVDRVDRGRNTSLGTDWYASPKVWLTAGVWIVYGIVLHAPISPNLRGRRAAMLSVTGFVLMVAAIVAAQFMPEVSR